MRARRAFEASPETTPHERPSVAAASSGEERRRAVAWEELARNGPARRSSWTIRLFCRRTD